MNKNIKKLLGLVALSMSMTTESNLYNAPSKNGVKFNPNYKVDTFKKELREFTIKGHKVMAYSKKDAIKRMKHKNSEDYKPMGGVARKY